MRKCHRWSIINFPRDDNEKELLKLSTANSANEKWIDRNIDLFDDEVFLIKTILFLPLIFPLLPEEFRVKESVCEAAISSCGSNLYFCPLEIRKNKRLVLRAFETVGHRFILKWVDKSLLYDLDVVFTAIKENAASVLDLPKELLTDDMLIDLICINPLVFKFTPQFHRNKDLVLRFSPKCTQILKWLEKGNPLLLDCEIYRNILQKGRIHDIPDEIVKNHGFWLSCEIPPQMPNVLRMELRANQGFLKSYYERFGSKVFDVGISGKPFRFHDCGLSVRDLTKLLYTTFFEIFDFQQDPEEKNEFQDILMREGGRCKLMLPIHTFETYGHEMVTSIISMLVEIVHEGSGEWYDYVVETSNLISMIPFDDLPSVPSVWSWCWSTLDDREDGIWTLENRIMFAKRNLECFFPARIPIWQGPRGIVLKKTFVNLIKYHYPGADLDSLGASNPQNFIGFLCKLAWRFDARFLTLIRHYETGSPEDSPMLYQTLIKKCLHEDPSPEMFRTIMTWEKCNEMDKSHVLSAVRGLNLEGKRHEINNFEYYTSLKWGILSHPSPMYFDLANDEEIYIAFRQTRKGTYKKVGKSANVVFRFE
jgi:hypothetical protein